MSWPLRQSTASQEIPLGPFVDSSDGNTAETDLTIANTDIKLQKNGATAQADKNSGGATHIATGDYYTVLDATDTDTVGPMRVKVHVSGALPVWLDCVVYEEAVYDRDFAASALGYVANAPVNVAQFGGSNLTAASGIPEVALTTSSRNAVADQVWDEATSGHVASGSFGAASSPTEAGTAQAGGAATITLRSGAVATDDYYNKQLLKIVAGTGVGQSEYVEDYVGSTKVATMAASWAVQPDNTSVYVIHAGGTIPGASAPTAGEVADAVWDEARADHVTATSFGALGTLLFRVNTAQAGTSTTITLDASASANNNQYRYSQISIIGGTGAPASRQISAYVGSSKVATVGVAWDVTPSSDSVFIITPLGVDAATIAAIADAIWDEARSGHASAGTFGEYVLADAVRISGDATAADNLESYTDGTTPMPVNATQISGDATAADNAEAFFDGTGYAGTNNVIPSVTTVTGNVNGNVAGSVGSVTGNVGGNVTGSIGSLAAQAKADVNAEALDVINTDTFTEPGQGSPAATASIVTKVGFVYKAWRNKHTQTSSEYALFADDGSTKDQEAGVADDGTTFTRNEVQTGA